MQFPIVRASGSHYEVGVTIGKTMREGITQVLDNSRKIFKDDYPKRLKESLPFQEQTTKYFPHYMDELRGMADGAQVSFDDLFLSNNREVADFDPFILDPNHCTIVGVPHQGEYLVGHNEDWDASSLSLLYVLDATVDGTKIFSLNYANNIIGDAASINGCGLIQGINELWHQDAQMGVPKNFIARAVLDCKTLEEAEGVIKTIPRAAGWNHVLTQGGRLWNMESSANEYVIEKIEFAKYAHTNHYLTGLKRIDKANPESEKRYEKVKRELEHVNAVEDIKRLLSDRNEPRICRESTIGSVVFDIPNKVAHIAYGQPTPESYVEYSLAHVLQ
ncbi:hypothetical protein HY086_05975 [Candidatus Gottesmanbacteria bacterium]|nr:hypothetical protein [Candidatus Gottesmanbacteria bacterium]